MKFAKTTTAAIAVLFIAGLLVTVAPVSTAQGEKKLKVDQVGSYVVKDEGQLNAGRLPPEIATLRIELNFKVTIPPVGACIDTITVTYTPPASTAQASIHVSPPSETKAFKGQSDGVPVSGAQGSEIEGFKATITVQLTRSAPAFSAINIPVTVRATGGGGSTSSGCGLTPSDAIQAVAVVVPDYAARVQYVPKTYTASTGQNKQVVFSINMINFSNGPTRVKTSIVEKTKGLESILPPVDTLLESKATSGPQARDTQEIFITARTPHSNGYTNKVYTFEAHFMATADAGGSTGKMAEDEKVVTMSVKVQGVYVPGFDATSLVAALGIALLGLNLVRRRRQD
jgi:hypothetical protein